VADADGLVDTGPAGRGRLTGLEAGGAAALALVTCVAVRCSREGRR
jgi:hypothetical protein